MKIIITCGSAKAITRSRAEKLYVGGHFKKCLAWAKAKVGAENVFIISAKYGLLKLDDMIEPYDLRMGQPGSVSTLVLLRQAEDLGIIDEEILSSAGADYQKPLVRVFQKIKFPFKGLTMGFMAQAMKKDLKC